MTPEKLREIKSVVNQTHDGPWSDAPHGYRTDIGYSMTKDNGERVLIPLFETRTNAKRADIVFVARAREDVPALIAEVERLTAERNALLDAVQEAADNLDFGYRHKEITETYYALCQLQAIIQKYPRALVEAAKE